MINLSDKESTEDIYKIYIYMYAEWKPESKKRNVAKLSFLNVGLKKLCLTTIVINRDLLKLC